MNEMMFEKYINMLTPGHIKQFADSENVEITEREVNLVYSTIKTRYKDLLAGDFTILETIKDELSEPVYKKTIELIEKYRYLLD